MTEDNAEQVECRGELITNILLRVSTRGVLKMCTVGNGWHTLVSDVHFVHTHHMNCYKESIIFLTHIVEMTMPEQ